MIFDHETDEEKSEARATAEQQLDRIYHAIPEWVNREYPQCTLPERIAKGFEQMQEAWTATVMREVQDHAKTRTFLVWLCKTHGLDFMKEYWNFLVSKDLDKVTSPEEKMALAKMKKS